MIELALNNSTMNVEYMEYNIMRELRVNEMEQVHGGIIWSIPRITVSLVGAYRTISSIKWGTASYDDMTIAP